jgi:hypothetical protein
MKTVLLFIGLSASSVRTAQVPPRVLTATSARPRHNLFRPAGSPYRSGGSFQISYTTSPGSGSFPAKLNKKRNWIPATVILDISPRSGFGLSVR